MLARMAANFYWMGRYVERTENTARLLEHQLARLVDAAADEIALGWRVLYGALDLPSPRGPADSDEAEAFLVADAYTLAGRLVEDVAHPDSMISCLTMARENAREIRPRLPLPVWVSLNQTYLWLREAEFAEAWREGPAALARGGIDRLRMLAGVVDASMARDDAWRFLETGRHVERLQQHLSLLAAWDRQPGRPAAQLARPAARLSWTGLLRVCGAYEPFRRNRSLALGREAVLAFLLRDPTLSRSARFALTQLQALLEGIDPAGARHPRAAPQRLALRMAASLEADAEELLPRARADAEDVDGVFERLAADSLRLHHVLMETYVEYPITSGLPA